MEGFRIPQAGGTERFSPVIELRQYTLHPGKREVLIELFDGEFVETQEATGMKVIGQFRDLDRPDRFVWLRGFGDMDERRRSLTAFYDGPVWAAHREAANATMIDSDDVLLLRPAWPGAGFDLAGATRGPRDAVAGIPRSEPDQGSSETAEVSADGSTPLILASIFHISPAGEAVALFDEAASLLSSLGAPPAATFVTEHAENTFPRLPVRESENVLVAFTRFVDVAALAAHQAALTASAEWRMLSAKLGQHFIRPAESLRLSPTSRSLLR